LIETQLAPERLYRLWKCGLAQNLLAKITGQKGDRHEDDHGDEKERYKTQAKSL